MPYPLTIFGNPRRRNPRSTLRFKDLRFHDVFEFDRSGLPSYGVSGLAMGPWVKLHGRKYARANGVSDVYSVGSINIRVIRLGAVGDSSLTHEEVRRRMGENPRRGRAIQQSKRVYEVAYKHVADGKDYKHKFASGVCMELLGDGSVRLYRMDGRPLFKNFPD